MRKIFRTGLLAWLAGYFRGAATGRRIGLGTGTGFPSHRIPPPMREIARTPIVLSCPAAGRPEDGIESPGEGAGGQPSLSPMLSSPPSASALPAGPTSPAWW